MLAAAAASAIVVPLLKKIPRSSLRKKSQIRFYLHTGNLQNVNSFFKKVVFVKPGSHFRGYPASPSKSIERNLRSMMMTKNTTSFVNI